MRIHPLQSYIVTGLEDGTVKLWDLDTQAHLHTFQRHPTGVISIAFSPDGQVLASGSRDWVIKIWDFKTKACFKLLDEQDKYLLGAIKFSSDGKMLAIASYDGCVYLWNTETWQCDRTLRGHTHNMTTSVDISSDSQLMISVAMIAPCGFGKQRQATVCKF